ncbi:glutamate receptor ionotropic, delta-2 [Culicoides brevitarsis]|uniref:glutamate receptor ionotropic, delta-2 n=1 Tax=Culicoides brevitarsis TaxID=469753 RepID=UPI00307B2DEE
MAFELILSSLCMNISCDVPEVPETTFYWDFNDTASSYEKKQENLQKIRDSLNGQVLKVTTLQDPPLSWSEEDENGVLVGKGIAFNLFNVLTEKFNFTYELILPKNNIIGSTDDFAGSLLEQVQTKQVDVAVAFLPILADAREHIRFSTGLDEGEYYMIMTRPAESASGSGLLAPFQLYVWLLILISLLAVGPCIYYLIILRNRLTKDEKQKIYPLPHCIWFVYGALMKQGSVLSPSADSTRILFATWWIFITILTSFYTANLTAFLTLSRFTLPFNTVEDIVQKDQRFVSKRGGGIEYSIKNQNEELNILQKLVNRDYAYNTMNDTEILRDRVEKKHYLYIRDRPAMDHLRYEDYKYRKTKSKSEEKKHCPFAVAKEPLLRRGRAFAYPLGTKWHSIFDPELLSLVEGGIVKYMTMDNLPKAEICPQQLTSTERQLRNNDLMTTYYVMLAGFLTSFVVFVTEFFFKCCNERIFNRDQTIKIQNLQPTVSTWATKTSGYSPPPSYSSLLDRIHNTKASEGLSDGLRQIINGREYKIVTDITGNKQLIPLRVPSAALFTYFTYNSHLQQ